MRPIVALYALAWIFWAGAAQANPDVWVQSKFTYLIDRGTVTGLDLEWHFDRYFSARTIAEFDVDKSGVLDPAEVSALRAKAFDPLREHDYYIHVWTGDEVGQVELADFDARIVDETLIYAFSVRLAPGVDYGTKVLATSLHDAELFIDFKFMDGQFLLVKGDFDPACKFRVSRGRGAQAGHPAVITLLCGV